MHRGIIIIIVLFGFFTSCRKEKTPHDILSQDQMLELLKEVHMMDSYFNTLPIDSTRKVIRGYYGELLGRYGLDSVGFEDNIRYYVANPQRGEEMYERLTNYFQGLDRELIQADSIRMAHRRDSLRQVNEWMRLFRESQKLIFLPDTLSEDSFADTIAQEPSFYVYSKKMEREFQNWPIPLFNQLPSVVELLQKPKAVENATAGEVEEDTQAVDSTQVN